LHEGASGVVKKSQIWASLQAGLHSVGSVGFVTHEGASGVERMSQSSSSLQAGEQPLGSVGLALHTGDAGFERMSQSSSSLHAGLHVGIDGTSGVQTSLEHDEPDGQPLGRAPHGVGFWGRMPMSMQRRPWTLPMMLISEFVQRCVAEHWLPSHRHWPPTHVSPFTHAVAHVKGGGVTHEPLWQTLGDVHAGPVPQPVDGGVTHLGMVKRPTLTVEHVSSSEHSPSVPQMHLPARHVALPVQPPGQVSTGGIVSLTHSSLLHE
jgi:hypothetical protein